MKRGVRRETHFLDWRWNPDLDGDGGALARCWHETFFDADAHADHPDLIAIDSTPSYLLQFESPRGHIDRSVYGPAFGWCKD